jgi:3-hydroxyisobutyrate dehydrogenase-like beta-hydroxyacid dehydrogenase
MGLPILERLLAAGHEVVAFDPLPERQDLAMRAGAAVELHPVDVLVTILPGPIELEAAMADAWGLAPLWIDLTSNDPSVATRLSREAEAHGVAYLSAAIAGGPLEAAAGTLAFFVGGPSAALDRARPVLESMGDRVEHVGDSAADGNTAKLLANLLWFGQAVAVTEALLLGQSLGLEPGRLRDILSRSAGGSVFLDRHAPALLAGDYLESFGIDRVVEELDVLSALAKRSGVPFELSDTVARLHREALEAFGAVDGELLAAKLLEGRAGRALRADGS